MIKPGNTHQISSLRFILVPAAAKICLLSLLHVVPFVELFISTSFINQTLEKLLAVSPTFKFQTLIKIDFLFSVVYTVSSNNFLIMFVKFGPKSLPLSFVYVMGVPLSTSFIQKGRCTEETSFQFPILSVPHPFPKLSPQGRRTILLHLSQLVRHQLSDLLQTICCSWLFEVQP